MACNWQAINASSDFCKFFLNPAPSRTTCPLPHRFIILHPCRSSKDVEKISNEGRIRTLNAGGETMDGAGFAIEPVVSDLLGEVAYIAWRRGRDEALVVDPGHDAGAIVEALGRLG